MSDATSRRLAYRLSNPCAVLECPHEKDPDTNKYRFMESSLAVSAEGVAAVHSPSDDTDDATIRHDGEERIDSTPKGHLEYVRDQQLKAHDVDSVTLIDE